MVKHHHHHECHATTHHAGTVSSEHNHEATSTAHTCHTDHLVEQTWHKSAMHSGGGGGVSDASTPRNEAGASLLFTPLDGQHKANTSPPFLNFSSPQYTRTAAEAAGLAQNQSRGVEQSQVGGTGANAPHTDKKFDSSRSVKELMTSGVFHDGTEGADKTGYQPLENGKVPKVTVVYENKDSNPQPPPPKPNYVVGKDGSVTVMHNPEGNPPDGNIVVQVQRDQGQTSGPTDQQQQSVNALVDYEAQRIQQQYAAQLPDVQTVNGPVKQVDISDSQNLVGDDVMHKFGDRLPPNAMPPNAEAPPALPPDVQSTSNTMSRVPGSNGSATIPRESAPGRQPGDASSPAGVDQIFPRREVPQPPTEAQTVAAMKDTAAALFNPDRAAPYETVRKAPGIGYQVGRYGLNQGFSMFGLAALLGIDLGDPPDLSKLQEYLASHPDALQKALHQYADQLRQGADKSQLGADNQVRTTADNLDKFASSLQNPANQQQFVKFLSDMGGNGDPITKDRVNQFMPKELQEAIAQKGIESMATKMGADPNHLSAQDASKVALGMFLGHTPTQAELGNQQYQGFEQAAGNMFTLGNTRMQGLGDITVTDAQGKIVAAANNSLDHQMWGKFANVVRGGRLGCAASVSAVLNEAGFSYVSTAGVSDLEHTLRAHGWTTDSSPRPGDVVCGYRGGSSSGSAHTGIIGTNGMSYDNHSSSGLWKSDPVSVWNSRSYPAGVVFLRPPTA